MNPNDPLICPSELVDNVLELLENAGVPVNTKNNVVEEIENWEESQKVPTSKYENWPPTDPKIHCSPEEVSNHISSTGLKSNTIIYDLKSNYIILDSEGNKWKFFQFWAGGNIKEGWVPKKGEYFISSDPKHTGEIFQMVGSVVACMTRHRFIIQRVDKNEE